MGSADEDSESQRPETVRHDDLPPVDFNILVLSLNTSTLIQLGDGPDDQGGSSLNLPMARQSIDMLSMLEEKTQGNLTGEEERLLHQVLFDLRLRFARKADSRP